VIPLRKKVAARKLMKTKLRVGDAILKIAAELKTAFTSYRLSSNSRKRLKAINESDANPRWSWRNATRAGNINDLEKSGQSAADLFAKIELDIAETTASISRWPGKLNRLMGTWVTIPLEDGR